MQTLKIMLAYCETFSDAGKNFLLQKIETDPLNFLNIAEHFFASPEEAKKLFPKPLIMPDFDGLNDYLMGANLSFIYEEDKQTWEIFSISPEIIDELKKYFPGDDIGDFRKDGEGLRDFRKLFKMIFERNIFFGNFDELYPAFRPLTEEEEKSLREEIAARK